MLKDVLAMAGCFILFILAVVFLIRLYQKCFIDGKSFGSSITGRLTKWINRHLGCGKE